MSVTTESQAAERPGSRPACPERGQTVRVGTRAYWVGRAFASPIVGPVVPMGRSDDDPQGQPLEVVMRLERDPNIPAGERVPPVGKRGIDRLRPFSVFNGPPQPPPPRVPLAAVAARDEAYPRTPRPPPCPFDAPWNLRRAAACAGARGAVNL